MGMKAEGCARRYLVAVTAVGRRLALLATPSRKEEREPQLRQSITDVMTVMTIFSSSYRRRTIHSRQLCKAAEAALVRPIASRDC